MPPCFWQVVIAKKNSPSSPRIGSHVKYELRRTHYPPPPYTLTPAPQPQFGLTHANKVCPYPPHRRKHSCPHCFLSPKNTFSPRACSRGHDIRPERDIPCHVPLHRHGRARWLDQLAAMEQDSLDEDGDSNHAAVQGHPEVGNEAHEMTAAAESSAPNAIGAFLGASVATLLRLVRTPSNRYMAV